MNLLPERYTVTAALPYANGPVHIGHLAGVYLPADIYVRYLRAQNRDVKFICGSDEHGVPITIRAQKEGVTPQQVVDKYHAIIRDSFREFNVSFDVYSRTPRFRASFSRSCTPMVNSLSKPRSSSTMSKPANFWLTVTSWVPAPIVVMKTPTVTSASAAARR
jgi:methionyl-tRNA synthetase